MPRRRGSVGDDQKGAKIFTPPPQIKSLGFLTAEIPNFEIFYQNFKVARYSFSGSIPPKFERKLRRHKQRFGKINTTVVLDKDENLL